MQKLSKMGASKKIPSKCKTIRPSVAIIIVTYNGEAFIKKCLESLEKQKYSQKLYHIIVVDNKSTDNTCKLVKEFPKVDLIENTHNDGFGIANNIGMEKAMTDLQPKYIALLNQDSWVEPNWLEKLVNLLEEHPQAGCCGAGEHPYNSTLKISEKEKKNKTAGSWMGCGTILFRTAALQEVGLFDDIYFMYGEDMDLTWRINNAGWKIIMNRDAVWHHDGGERQLEGYDWRVFFSLRNRVFLLIKFGSLGQVIRSLRGYGQHFFFRKKRPLDTNLNEERSKKDQKDKKKSKLDKCFFCFKLCYGILKHLPLLFKRRRELQKRGINYNQTDEWIRETDSQLFGMGGEKTI